MLKVKRTRTRFILLLAVFLPLEEFFLDPEWQKVKLGFKHLFRNATSKRQHGVQLHPVNYRVKSIIWDSLFCNRLQAYGLKRTMDEPGYIFQKGSNLTCTSGSGNIVIPLSDDMDLCCVVIFEQRKPDVTRYRNSHEFGTQYRKDNALHSGNEHKRNCLLRSPSSVGKVTSFQNCR